MNIYDFKENVKIFMAYHSFSEEEKNMRRDSSESRLIIGCRARSRKHFSNNKKLALHIAIALVQKA